MPLFIWTEEFHVNIEEMDQQHKQLVDLVNYLHDAILDNKIQEALDKVFEELLDYMESHFQREEELMELHGYPDYISHKSEHVTLIKDVAGLLKNPTTGNYMIARHALSILDKWVTNHILIEDKKYVPYLSGKMVV